MIDKPKHVKVYDLQHNLIGEFSMYKEVANHYGITLSAVMNGFKRNSCVDKKYYIKSEGPKFITNAQRESFNCKCCGIKICDKNKYVIDPGIGKYISSKCRACFINAKFCVVHYESEELELLSKRMSQNISKHIWQLRNPKHQQKIRTQDKEKQKEKVKEFDERYIRLLICRETKLNLKVEDIPDKLVELKKKELVIKRNFKNQGIWVR